MKRCPCKGPEQLFVHKTLNQHKEQSIPFFQITAKFHLLLLSSFLGPVPTAWESFLDFSPQGGRNKIVSCDMQRWNYGERKDQAHLWFRHPKVCHPSLNLWPQVLFTSSHRSLHLTWKWVNKRLIPLPLDKGSWREQPCLPTTKGRKEESSHEQPNKSPGAATRKI